MAMKWTPVKSSHLARVGYHAPSKTLAIQFHGGATYHYPGVDSATHAGLITAASPGSYFRNQIAPRVKGTPV